jgi:hypothetical protein
MKLIKLVKDRITIMGSGEHSEDFIEGKEFLYHMNGYLLLKENCVLGSE